MLPSTTIRDALADRGYDHGGVGGGSPVCAAVVDPGGGDPSAAVRVVETATSFVFAGEADDGALRFDWGGDAPRHRSATDNPNHCSLSYLADAMNLSRDEARRAITGLHHDPAAGSVWKGSPMTQPVIGHSTGVLPESETGMHSYHYYVE